MGGGKQGVCVVGVMGEGTLMMILTTLQTFNDQSQRKLGSSSSVPDGPLNASVVEFHAAFIIDTKQCSNY